MKIIIATGGTYGHIYPALSLISALKKKNIAEIILVTPNKELKLCRTSDVPHRAENVRTYFISGAKIEKDSLLSFIGSLVRATWSVCTCLFILLRTRPQVVVGFGSYAAFPLIFSACFLGIPAFIHEQNVVMGKANRFLSYFAREVLVSFEKTRCFLPLPVLRKRKYAVVGNPIRQDLKAMDKKESKRHLGLHEDLFTVLVMGGSLGSHKINERFTEAITFIKTESLQVIHLTGKDDFEFVRQFYNRLDLPPYKGRGKPRFKNRIFSFSDEMSCLFSAADLIISRSGGSTISEISCFKIPSILIPYPYAGGHQMENAKILAGCGTAVIIEDKNLDARLLAGYLDNFIEHPEELVKMREKFGENNMNAAERMAEEVLKSVHSQ